MLLPILVVFAVIIGQNCVESVEKRNVLIILADDAGFEMAAYRNKICQTPNLDKLAKRSLIFNNAYTSVSSCSPSRAALLTGMPSHQNGMYGLHHDVHNFNSFKTIESLPNILGKNGVRTGIIGKKHVGPASVFKFDYEQTEENNSILQVGRNITHIKLLAREFLNSSSSPFFLYVAFHDPHRCGHTHPEYGEFCERFGNGETNMGTIPDWKPIYYQPEQIQLPYFIPDLPDARKDVADQYTTISRLDQGVGLLIEELERSNHLNDTLIIYTSDNGIPFPNGRINLYESGVGVPLLMSSPFHTERRYQVTYSLSSLLDIVPTVLDWFSIPNSHENDIEAPFITGHSLLPLLIKEPENTTMETVFASHNFHEITMSYPMRMIRTQRYKLIHNLDHHSTFLIDQDLYLSRTFHSLLIRTQLSMKTNWFKRLQDYYSRPELELYDLKNDPQETANLAYQQWMSDIVESLKQKLFEWQNNTNDPWRCLPGSVLEDKGDYKDNPQCFNVGT